MKTIAIIAATAREISTLVRMTGAVKCASPGPGVTYEGQCGRHRIVLAETGIGKVNTTSVLTVLLGRNSPDLLINTGCAGAYGGSSLAVGDLAIATAEIYGDEGVLTISGWEPLDCIGIPVLQSSGKSYFNELPISADFVAKAVRFAAVQAISIESGKFVTVSTCSGTSVRGVELAARFDAICENMEGAAAAHVALMYGVAFLEIRGISNIVEDRDLSRWDITRACENVQRFIHSFIESL
jgi:futalosine hydrolase